VNIALACCNGLLAKSGPPRKPDPILAIHLRKHLWSVPAPEKGRAPEPREESLGALGLLAPVVYLAGPRDTAGGLFTHPSPSPAVPFRGSGHGWFTSLLHLT